MFVSNTKKLQQQLPTIINQQLIYGSSKFIFYEQSKHHQRKITNPKYKFQKIFNNKDKTVSDSLRSHTANSKTRQLLTRKFKLDLCDKRNKQNSKATIDLYQNDNVILPKVSTKIIQSQCRPKTSFYHLRCLQNQYTSRKQIQKMKESQNFQKLFLNQDQNNSIIKSQIEKVNSDHESKQKQKQNLMQQQIKSEQKPIEQFQKQVLTTITAQKSQQNQLIKTKLSQKQQDTLEQFKKNQSENISHQQIRNLFGFHHGLMKEGTDYLCNFKVQPNKENKLIDKLIVKQNSYKNILRQQQYLEQEIKYLNHTYPSPSKIGKPISTIQNKKQVPESLKLKLNGFGHSLIVSNKIQRAPIVKFIKNQEGKQLFNILIESTPQQKYIDKQFNHLNITKINNQQIEWVFIEPNPAVKIFPQPNQDLYKNYIVENKQKYHQLNLQKQLPFVIFLRILYQIQPWTIKRIFQPAIRNIYSVWFFLNGCFQPIFVDGYFPLDSYLNHIYGGSDDKLWLPILIKCICKVYNTYSNKQLQKIENQQVYKLLTGLEFQTICQQKQYEVGIDQKIKQQFGKGNHIISINTTNNELLVLKVSQIHRDKIYAINPLTRIVKPFSQIYKTSLQIIGLKPVQNHLIYTIQAKQNSLSKLQFTCQKNTQIIFSAKSINHANIWKRKIRIYIYQCEGYDRKSNKIRLVLKQQAQVRYTFKSVFKKGNYKIFIQEGKRKIHLLFNQKLNVKQYVSSSQFSLSILTNNEIKLSKLEQLTSHGNKVQDSGYVYQNPNFLA